MNNYIDKRIASEESSCFNVPCCLDINKVKPEREPQSFCLKPRAFATAEEFVEVPLTSEDEQEDLVDLREQIMHPYGSKTHQSFLDSNLTEVGPIFPRNIGYHSGASAGKMAEIFPVDFFQTARSLSVQSDSDSTSPIVLRDPPVSITELNRTPSFAESYSDLKFNDDFADDLNHHSLLFSPSIVRAIASDIEEIKRSLSAPIKSPQLLPAKKLTLLNSHPNHAHKKAEHKMLPVCSNYIDSKSEPVYDEKALLFGRHLDELKSRHNRRHRNSESVEGRERSFFARIKTRGLTKDTMIQSNGHVSKISNDEQAQLSTQQWTFPVHVNTVYSSGSNNDSDSRSSNSICTSETERVGQPDASSPQQQLPACTLNERRLSDVFSDKLRIETHDGEWSLRTGRPRTADSTEGSTSHTRMRRCSIGDELSPRQIKVAANVHSAISEPPLIVPGHEEPNCTLELHPIRRNLLRENDYESDEDTDHLLNKQYRSDKPVEIPELKKEAEYQSVKRQKGREVAVHHPDFPDRLIEGFLYPSRYLGSTQLTCDSRPSKGNRLRQAQEAVNRIKAPSGENQPSVPVELFISTERILILNKKLNEIVMDHNLRLISYIADIGDILVLMTRRLPPPQLASPTHPTTEESGENQSASDALRSGSTDNAGSPSSIPSVQSSSSSSVAGSTAPRINSKQNPNQPSKIICHLFESDEAQMVAQAIGQAFQEAYFDFLRERGIEDPAAYQEQDYENVLSQQEIYRNELQFFADKKQEKEVIVPKQRGESLGVVIVESGWGSVLPTVVLANMHPSGPAARCGQLNIGNQIISVNGQSLVGLPLNTCQSYFKSTKGQTAVKLVVVNCPPVVEVLIRRPELKYQLGFSVQDGVICSLLRGGIAERGGIRVDHRIIEINGESVVAVPHERIVDLLASAVGEIYIRTMPTSIFRLLTGQDAPHYI